MSGGDGGGNSDPHHGGGSHGASSYGEHSYGDAACSDSSFPWGGGHPGSSTVGRSSRRQTQQAHPSWPTQHSRRSRHAGLALNDSPAASLETTNRSRIFRQRKEYPLRRRTILFPTIATIATITASIELWPEENYSDYVGTMNHEFNSHTQMSDIWPGDSKAGSMTPLENLERHFRMNLAEFEREFYGKKRSGIVTVDQINGHVRSAFENARETSGCRCELVSGDVVEREGIERTVEVKVWLAQPSPNKGDKVALTKGDGAA